MSGRVLKPAGASAEKWVLPVTIGLSRLFWKVGVAGWPSGSMAIFQTGVLDRLVWLFFGAVVGIVLITSGSSIAQSLQLVRWTLNRCAFWVLRTLPQNAPPIGPLIGRYEVAPIFLIGQVFGSALKRQGSSEKALLCPGYQAQPFSAYAKWS